MASKKVKVIYQDGRPEEIVKVLPRAQVMAEQHFGGIKAENAISVTYYFGWAALQSTGKVTVDFETWLNTIDDVEDYEEPVDPTQGDQSADTSPDSPS